MTDCDSCGRPIGHADQICVVYTEDAVDMGTPEWDENRAVFGSKECRRLFEEHHQIEEEDVIEE